MGKMDGCFSNCRSNQTSSKKPNTIYIFTGIMSYSGNPLLQSRHQRIYKSTRSTGLWVFVFLFNCVTCHSNLRNSDLVWKPLKKNKNRLLDKRDHDCCHARHVTLVNTNYANKKSINRSVFCLL